jgi:hypothetical protein
MNREEQIVEAGKAAAQNNKFSDLAMKQHRVMSAYELGFIDGAVWADANPGWVSVDERMPEQQYMDVGSAWVLVASALGVQRAYYDYEELNWNDERFRIIDSVSHWMPIPAPPK